MGAGESWHHEVTSYDTEVRRYVKMVTSCHIFRVVVVLCCGLVWSSCGGVFIWRWSVSVSYTQAPCRQANKKSSQEEQHKAKRFAHTHTKSNRNNSKRTAAKNLALRGRKISTQSLPRCIIGTDSKAQSEGRAKRLTIRIHTEKAAATEIVRLEGTAE